MLAELRKRFPAAHALSGTAEKIPLTDASADAVLVGQAFHWFDVPRALDEIARVLRPGGVLGVLWNYEDTRVPWVDGFETQVRSKAGKLRTAATPLPDDHPRFEPFEQETFDHSVRRTADSLAAMIGTHSHMLVASEEERAAIIDRMMKYLRAQPETSKGEFDLPLRTVVLKTRRQR
jgi:ubiquinone/menaquinone biosynthesis C-methylase UbiE